MSKQTEKNKKYNKIKINETENKKIEKNQWNKSWFFEKKSVSW